METVAEKVQASDYWEAHPLREDVEEREQGKKHWKKFAGLAGVSSATLLAIAGMLHQKGQNAERETVVEKGRIQGMRSALAEARSGLVIQEHDEQTGEVKKTEVTLEMGNPNLIDPPGGRLIIGSEDSQVHCFELPRAGNSNGGIEYAYLVQQRVGNQWKKLLIREGSVSLAERGLGAAEGFPLSKHDVGMANLPSQGKDVAAFLNRELQLPEVAANAPTDIAKWFRDVVLRKLRAAANGTLDQHHAGSFTLSFLPDGDILFEDQQSHLTVIMDSEGKNIIRGSTKPGSLDVQRGAGNALYEIVSDPEFFNLAQGLVRLQEENPQAHDLAAEIEREHFSFEVPALRTDEFPNEDRIPLLRSALMPMGQGYAYGVTYFRKNISQARANRLGTLWKDEKGNYVPQVVNASSSPRFLVYVPHQGGDPEYFIVHDFVGWFTPRASYPLHLGDDPATKNGILSDEATVSLLSTVPPFNLDADPIYLPSRYDDGLGVTPGRATLSARARIAGAFHPVFELDSGKFSHQLSQLNQLRRKLHPEQASKPGNPLSEAPPQSQ